MALNNKEVAVDLSPLLIVYTDGTVHRLTTTTFTPPSISDQLTGVSSKDITISATISGRLYHPKLTLPEKLPILVYFRRGLCSGSAFSADNHRYLNTVVSEARVVALSVEYRLAPEFPLPAAYEDAWCAVQWVASQAVTGCTEKWLSEYGDFDRVYIGGDSTGANIAHNIAMRAGIENLHGNMKILGAFLCQPYFWGSNPIASEPILGHQENMICRSWLFVYPSAADGIDNPAVNPFVTGAPSLAGLGCKRILVCVGENEVTKYRAIHYCNVLRESGWSGEVNFHEVKGGDHGFHFRDPRSEMAKDLVNRLASFLR